MTAIDLTRQQAQDDDPRTAKHVNMLTCCNATILLLLKKRKKKLYFLKGIVKVLLIAFFNKNMTKFNTVNVKLSNSQLNKLKSAIKNKAKTILRLSTNTIGESNE